MYVKGSGFGVFPFVPIAAAVATIASSLISAGASKKQSEALRQASIIQQKQAQEMALAEQQKMRSYIMIAIILGVALVLYGILKK